MASKSGKKQALNRRRSSSPVVGLTLAQEIQNEQENRGQTVDDTLLSKYSGNVPTNYVTREEMENGRENLRRMLNA